MIADYEYVPLTRAHIVIGVSRATVYRWHNDGELSCTEIAAAPGKAFKLHVRAGELRKTQARMDALKHAPKKRTTER